MNEWLTRRGLQIMNMDWLMCSTDTYVLVMLINYLIFIDLIIWDCSYYQIQGSRGVLSFLTSLIWLKKLTQDQLKFHWFSLNFLCRGWRVQRIKKGHWSHLCFVSLFCLPGSRDWIHASSPTDYHGHKVVVCFRHATPSHYHHYAWLLACVEHKKCLPGISCRECV